MSLKLQLFICIIFFSFVIQSCKPDGADCSNYKSDYKNISDENRNKIPYHGYDTLVYISNSNDTVSLIGIGKKNDFEEGSQSYTPVECGNRCYTYYERIVYNFSSNNIHLPKMMVSYLKHYDGISINLLNQSCFGNIDVINNLKFIYDSISYDNRKVPVALISNINDSTFCLYNCQIGVVKIIQKDANMTWTLLK
jgi:hypothetical protein